jgi:DNA-binding NarL/FixJ family response regulator
MSCTEVAADHLVGAGRGSLVSGGRTPRARLRILIVDDHEIVRQGLLATLSHKYDVVAAAANAAEALREAERSAPDVAIVDLRLPDLAGDELCSQLRARCPNTAVVILTTYVNDETVRRAIQAGASAYVTKAAGLPELLEVLRRLEDETARGSADPTDAPQIVAQLHALVARRLEAAPLTPQQENILELAAQGLTNREVGARLYISESTVRFHLQKLKAKFDARSKTDLIARAIRSGAISPAPEGTSSRDS